MHVACHCVMVKTAPGAIQVIQQEVESLKREKPALTPRPSRDLAPIRAFIDTDKVTKLRATICCRLHTWTPLPQLQTCANLL